MENRNILDKIVFSIKSLGIRKNDNSDLYLSTQLIPMKLALIANHAVSLAASESIGIFKIRHLALIYSFILLFAIGMIIRAVRQKNTIAGYVAAVMMTLIFLDAGYLSYLNSFFGEASVFVFFLLLLGVALNSVKDKNPPIGYMAGFYAAAVLFAGAKEANAPIGIILALYGMGFLLLRKDLAAKITVLLGTVLLVSFSFYLYYSIPESIQMTNKYQAVFYGVIRNSDTPEEDLQELGLDPKLAVLKDTTSYDKGLPVNPRSDEFRRIFYDRISFPKVAMFYLKHPSRLIQKMEITARNSMMIRPPYLGNYSRENGFERLKFTSRYTLWSSFKKASLPNSLLFLAVFFLAYLSALIYEYIRLKRFHSRPEAFMFVSLFMVLWLTAVLQFVIPFIGVGEADLPKHMFLFNICFDSLIASGLIWAAARLIPLAAGVGRKLNIRKTAYVISVVVLFAAVLILWPEPGSHVDNVRVEQKSAGSAQLREGDYVKFGRFLGQPILDVKEIQEYVYERGLSWKKRPTAEAIADCDYKDPGLRTDRFGSYWLRTPYYGNSSYVRYVGEDGYVYHKDAFYGMIGIAPALYLKTDTAITGGTGKKSDPFIVEMN